MAGISRITIDQQLAEIGVNITPAKLHIERGRMQMKISTESSQMEIEQQEPTFKVNREKINNESGLKTPEAVTMAYRDEGKSGAMRGARTAKDDGNFLGETRNRGDRVARLAHNKAMSRMGKKQTNLDLMPKSLPEVEWSKGSMRINWSKHSVVIDWDGEYMPKLTVDPRYSIEVFLRTEPYFHVSVQTDPGPNAPGNIVDKAV